MSVNADIILNAILVDVGIRPAFLIQPQDYDESKSSDPITKRNVDIVLNEFPTLKASDSYETYQGTIISKTSYNGRNNITLVEMGKILGYPCAEDFGTNSNLQVGINVVANLQNNEKAHLLANLCANDSKINIFQDIAGKASSSFQNEKYKNLLFKFGIEVKNVQVEIEKQVSTIDVLKKLVNNQKIDKDDVNKITNLLFNFGFSSETQASFMNLFQFNNPIHKGILIDLLLREMNDTMSPFYPLQNYPEQYASVKNITQSWEADLIDTLRLTRQEGKINKITNFVKSLFLGGGKSKRKNLKRKNKTRRR